MVIDSDARLSHFADHLGYWLHFVASQVSARLERLLAEREMTMNDWLILRTLFQDPGIPHHTLVRLLGMGRTGTWKAVQRLERRGFIRHELAPGEARCQELSLTGKGEALVPELAALAEDHEFHFFFHLAPHVREALTAALRQLATRHDFGYRRESRRLKNQPANGL
jgi:DNA-binding MarR family transcriptional regulator